MKKLIIAFLLVIPSILFSQDQSIIKLRNEVSREIKKEADTIPRTWKKGGIYGITISQSTLNNWAAGGENFSLAVNSALSVFAFYKKGKNSWDNTFDMNLGYVRTSSLGGRKNDDRIDLFSKYGHDLTPKLQLAALFNFRSQIFRGYTFTDSSKIHVSGFMSPGYLLLGTGINYKMTKNLSIFISPVTAKLIVVKDTAISNKGLYGVEKGKSVAFEIGAFATINYLKEFNKYITYKGRLDLYSNYRHNPQNVDVYMTNLLNAKLGKIFSITYGLDLIYDDDVHLFGKNKNSAALQLKSMVGIGLVVKF